MKRVINILACIAVFCTLGIIPSVAQVIKVDVVQNNGNWTFMRNGEPYYVKGAGGQTHLDILTEIGGNSIRTWGIENAEEVLDQAHKKGLTVMMGFWVQHERHGFDYNDEVAVKKQLDHFTDVVGKLKDHPALLLWGVGNEVDLNYTNTKVWNAVQDIAAMCHRLDPNHPTTTVTAGLDKSEVELIVANCPDIDIYSINTYGDISSIHKDLKAFGWNGPYMITEWGPNGHWESPVTDWGAAVEQSSYEKAISYDERYAKHIAAKDERCIGSYVFLWGQKQEQTSSWYGIFTADGKCSPVIDVLNSHWSNSERNKAPILKNFQISGTEGINKYFRADSVLTLQYELNDPDDKKMRIALTVVPESTDKKSGGDAEAAPEPMLGLVKKKSNSEALIRTPKKLGAYRVFIYVFDRHGNFTTHNIPFYVSREVDTDNSDRIVRLKQKTLEIPEIK